MKNNSPTPLTDAINKRWDGIAKYGQEKMELYTLARSLERTLATTEKERDEWKDSALNGGNAGYLRQQLASTQLAAVKLREALGKYATAMDALYNHSDASREAVVLHFGIHHPDFSTPITTEALDSYVAEKVKETP